MRVREAVRGVDERVDGILDRFTLIDEYVDRKILRMAYNDLHDLVEERMRARILIRFLGKVRQ